MTLSEIYDIIARIVGGHDFTNAVYIFSTVCMWIVITHMHKQNQLVRDMVKFHGLWMESVHEDYRREFTWPYYPKVKSAAFRVALFAQPRQMEIERVNFLTEPPTGEGVSSPYEFGF